MIRFALLPAVSALAALFLSLPAAAQTGAAPCPALLQHTVPRLQDDKPQALCQYAGKVLLVVNTASYCGYTPQYQGLEALHAKYAARGLVVMGFPSNDFNQEDADAGKIAELCFNTYGVKFPMFAKTAVKGAQAHALYQEPDQGHRQGAELELQQVPGGPPGQGGGALRQPGGADGA
jgi:glutathione peroxidase